MLPTPRVAFWEHVERLTAQGWRVIDVQEDPPRIRLCRRVRRLRFLNDAAPRADPGDQDECLELGFDARGEFQRGPLPCTGDPCRDPHPR